jgi:hypothetical protein
MIEDNQFLCHCRWKNKDVHDIMVECAQLSLDLFDGCVGNATMNEDHSMQGLHSTVHYLFAVMFNSCKVSSNVFSVFYIVYLIIMVNDVCSIQMMKAVH